MIIREIIEALEELSDVEAQKRLWVNGGPEGVSSFTEAICGVFDDGGVTRALESGELAQRPKLQKLFEQLDALVGKVDEGRPPDQIIQDPEMAVIRDVASQLLSELKN
jgi:hypothetical protein